MSDESLTQMKIRLALEEKCREIATHLRAKVPAGVGFILFLADYGEKGNTAFVSTIARDSSHELVREWLDNEGANHDDDDEGWQTAALFVSEVARAIDFKGEPEPAKLLATCRALSLNADRAANLAANISRATGYTGAPDVDALLEHCRQLAAKAKSA